MKFIIYISIFKIPLFQGISGFNAFVLNAKVELRACKNLILLLM